jgi:hypothetical protein
MPDTTITVKDASGDLVPIAVRLNPDLARRQVVVIGDGETANLLSPATETTLAAILAELGQKLEAGQAVALDAATLAALEQVTVTVSNPPDLSAMATETTLAAILAELGQKLEAGQAVALDAATLAALEQVTVTVSGTVTPAAAGDVASTLTDGRKTVTTPGTAVALAASTPCKWVQVVALKTNTQQVNVGGSDVLAASGSSTGTPLDAGQSTTIPVTNANKVFVDARVSGEGVSFTVGA